MHVTICNENQELRMIVARGMQLGKSVNNHRMDSFAAGIRARILTSLGNGQCSGRTLNQPEILVDPYFLSDARPLGWPFPLFQLSLR